MHSACVLYKLPVTYEGQERKLFVFVFLISTFTHTMYYCFKSIFDVYYLTLDCFYCFHGNGDNNRRHFDLTYCVIAYFIEKRTGWNDRLKRNMCR